ncbi:MAG TPA: epoxide hydrolase [Vicinamibacterales bacterium]|nr:epoxide hydrolase [Vicinamibacterales bacterium]
MNAVPKQAGADDTAIRPFHVNFPEAQLVDLRKRINATVWPDKETVSNEDEGVQLATMQNLARYWVTEYDWRKIEAKINAVPNFVTTIDGLEIHFIHVKSKHKNALPIIITHGWPGSIIEQMKLIEPLTNPTAYGGTAADAFDVVIPSMPGYGFSERPTSPGWDTPRMARAWAVLMKRLGYTRYVAQGGDWGSFVTEQMGLQAPPGLLGININLPSALPPEILAALPSHVPPAGLGPDEQRAFERLDFFFVHGLSYALQMANHPQTLYGIADSPIGLAAWFLEHDLLSYQMIRRSFEGKPEGLTRDDVLDNITLTWLTNTGISGARLYRENKLPFFVPMGVTLPVSVSAFPDELYQCPKSWAERAYPNLIHYNKLPKGGHFAAWEQPQFMTEELRASFKTLRTQ